MPATHEAIVDTAVEMLPEGLSDLLEPLLTGLPADSVQEIVLPMAALLALAVREAHRGVSEPVLQAYVDAAVRCLPNRIAKQRPWGAELQAALLREKYPCTV